MPKPLTIGIDIRDLRVAKTGTKTYLEELCKEFKKMESDNLRFEFLDSLTPIYTGNKKALKIIEHFKYQFWKQITLPLKAFFNGCDILFCTDNCVPLVHFGYKTIPVFHDAFCFEMPGNYGKLWLWTYIKTAVPAARRSPFVITPSSYSKKQINHYTQIPGDKLVVIYEGPKNLDSGDWAHDSEKVLDKFSLTKGKYILHVGSMFKRKNLPALIQAFGKVKSTTGSKVKLVLSGPTPANNFDSDHTAILAAIEEASLQNDVIITGYLPDGCLGELYGNALMYVFPSINEGFGIPILEAFKAGIPVLVANNSCLPEIGGDAVLLFDPFDVDDMAQKMSDVLKSEGLQKRMIADGHERLKEFSWKKTAVELVAIFKKAANRA